MLEFMGKIKGLIQRFITSEMIDKILGYLQKAQEILAKIIEHLIQAKDWIYNQVMRLFG